jgi:hypothetical protein
VTYTWDEFQAALDLDPERPLAERLAEVQERELGRLRDRLARAEAEYAKRPAYIRRDMLRDSRFFAEHRDEITRAQREGRILPLGAPLPPGGRWLGAAASAEPTATFTRSSLRDHRTYEAYAERVRAGLPTAVEDDIHQLIERRKP